MADNKQYFRDIQSGDVSIEGRQSNGITADNAGNVFIYSGLNNNELQTLEQQNFNGNVAINGNINSFLGIIKNKPQENLTLGNNNYETLNEKVDTNKIITATPQTPIFDPCKNKKILIVGDSITAEYYNGDRTGTWAVKFKDNQKDKDTKILAIGGKRLIDWMKPELEKELKTNKYDTVIIYGGVNDIFSSKTTSQVIKALQSMVDTVKNNGGQTIVITGYDSEKDMDVNKMAITKYVKTADEYKPLLEEYKTYQKTINTIKGALIIPKISVGVIGDGFHPSGKQVTKLYDHIIANIPKCGDPAKTTPSNQPKTTPSNQQKQGSPPIKEEIIPDPAPQLEGGFIFLDETTYAIEPTQLTGDFTPFTKDIIQYGLDEEIPANINIPRQEPSQKLVSLQEFKTLPARIQNSDKFKKFISTPGVKEKLQVIVDRMGVTVNDLIVIINLESAGTFSPSVQNPDSKATGLIQFMPSTAKGLGTTIEALKNMTILEQLEYVDKFFIGNLKAVTKGTKLKNGVYDLYSLVFFPAATNKPQDWIIQSKKNSAQAVSCQNPLIAKAAKKPPCSPVTVGDFYTYINTFVIK